MTNSAAPDSDHEQFSRQREALTRLEGLDHNPFLTPIELIRTATDTGSTE
ncbi:hypothetical protein JK358_17375 [Nocardia sp. 2]|uniref:Uncharacterized protein n=1 Tax=Nocardia acididurans TaxID=2802282 RepID=A0ABS1M698_9NOCA|nr:hypothetical protein [Nocardia acididurans]MBL1076172.1 hypothetical protein [Nocardia acididurans]